jgi:hypothetical protein
MLKFLSLNFPGVSGISVYKSGQHAGAGSVLERCAGGRGNPTAEGRGGGEKTQPPKRALELHLTASQFPGLAPRGRVQNWSK